MTAKGIKRGTKKEKSLPGMKFTPISATILPEQRKFIENLAESEAVSSSVIIRRLIHEKMMKKEKK